MPWFHRFLYPGTISYDMVWLSCWITNYMAHACVRFHTCILLHSKPEKLHEFTPEHDLISCWNSQFFAEIIQFTVGLFGWLSNLLKKNYLLYCWNQSNLLLSLIQSTAEFSLFLRSYVYVCCMEFIIYSRLELFFKLNDDWSWVQALLWPPGGQQHEGQEPPSLPRAVHFFSENTRWIHLNNGSHELLSHSHD